MVFKITFLASPLLEQIIEILSNSKVLTLQHLELLVTSKLRALHVPLLQQKAYVTELLYLSSVRCPVISTNNYHCFSF